MNKTIAARTRTNRKGAVIAGLLGALAIGALGAIGAVTQPSEVVTATLAPEPVLGVWDGTLTGDPQLPPEGAPFTMTVELNKDGEIAGTFDLGDAGFLLEIKEAEFNEEDGSFSCTLYMQVEEEEVTADLTATVDGADMDGSLAADDFAADFTASKEE